MDQIIKPSSTRFKAMHRGALSFALVNLGIATLLMLIFCPSCFLSLEGLKSLIPDFIYSFLISMILSFGGGKVEELYEKRVSWIYEPVKRLILTVATYMAYSFVASFIFVFAFTYLDGQFELSDIPWRSISSFTTTPMTVALVFMAIFTTASWLGEWRKSAIEAEQLKSERLAFQYQSLKDQLNPHFLFNSLNVLSNLVYEDADRSAAFIQKLSRIYRYVLDVQQEDLVALDRELEFARDYMALQQIRFDQSLQFQLEIQEADRYFIPPLSLQLLLENAIKHNVASGAKPLLIHISQEGNELWISNTFQPKSSLPPSSNRLGLSNIQKRYGLLGEREPTIQKLDDRFIVQLPLLRLS